MKCTLIALMFISMLASSSCTGGSGTGGGSGGGDSPNAGGGDSNGGGSGSAGGGATGGGTASTSVTINFDELGGATTVTAQYAPRVTFSGSGPVEAKQWRTDTNHSAPNFICSGQCTGDLTLEFGQPVDRLQFRIIGADGSGSVATMKITAGGATTTQPLMGGGSFTQPVPVDLSGTAGITRLEIVSVTDAFGIGFDDFSFVIP